MKLDEFVASVLHDINSGLSQAKSKTGRKYYIKVSDDKGVSFDIAVTTANSSGTQIEGAVKAGFIEVVGAKMGAQSEDKEENSQVSRIQFTVVPHAQTEEEERADEIAWRHSNENVTEDQIIPETF